MSMIPRAHTPPVQTARKVMGWVEPPRTQKVLSPMAPQPSRMEQRPVVLDGWGRHSLAGNDSDRVVVPEQSASFPVPPIACAVAGFVLYSLLSR